MTILEALVEEGYPDDDANLQLHIGQMLESGRYVTNRMDEDLTIERAVDEALEQTRIDATGIKESA